MEVCLEIDDTAKKIHIPEIIVETFLKRKITEVLLLLHCKIQIFVPKDTSFCDLQSIAEIKDGSRLKIIRIENCEGNLVSLSNLRKESYNNRIHISIHDFSLLSQTELKETKKI